MSLDDYTADKTAEQTGNTGSTARSRRDVLKMGAAAIAGSTAVTKTLQSSPNPETIRQQALEILRQTGSHEAFQQHLLDNGFQIEMQTSSHPRTDAGQVNTGGV